MTSAKRLPHLKPVDKYWMMPHKTIKPTDAAAAAAG
jgi:hypothetical protein